jgi:hypothetical protein
MDNLDFSHGMQAFLSGFSGSSLVGMSSGRPSGFIVTALSPWLALRHHPCDRTIIPATFQRDGFSKMTIKDK